LADVKLCAEGRKVGSSEAALLQMLDMKPFTYGLKLVTCYDEGVTFPAELLNKTAKDVYAAFAEGVGQVAALSLAVGFPTLPAFPHVVGGGFRKCLAVALATEYSFKQADAFKNRAAAGPAVVDTPKPVVQTKEPPKPAAPAAVSSSSSQEEFGDIFG